MTRVRSASARALLHGRAALALWLALAALCWTPTAALAHKPSDSYLTLRVDAARIKGQWDIALRDLDFALALDANGDGEITWGEVRNRQADIAAYALSRLQLSADGRICSLAPGDQLIERHTDGAYAVLRFEAACTGPPSALEVTYRLFFDLDRQHKGLLRLVRDGAESSAIFGVDQPVLRLSGTPRSAGQVFGQYLREGIHHIWSGFDHILFLLSLLLPSVLIFVRRPASGTPAAGAIWSGRIRTWLPSGAWRGASAWRATCMDVLRIVTAFSLAHSITLTLATLGVVNLPSRWVESTIAASVAVAALANVLHPQERGRAVMAFGFGLIHGFGFAAVLSDLGLPRGVLGVALVAFNLGVEIGQLAIVAVFLPCAWWMRDTWAYRRLTLGAGSLLIAAVAAFWFAERAFDLQLL